MKLKLSNTAKKAIMVGTTCSSSYLAVYIARNILGAISPYMINDGVINENNIGTLSAVYFITYALGQLINGKIGDKIKAKYMICFGLMLAGVCNMVFSSLKSFTLMCIAYGMSGFFLSMIYGPMTKTVSENTDPPYTTRCALGYTFASFLGTPLAGVLASFIVWQGVLAVGGTVLIVMGAVCFIVFSLFEKKGIIKYGKYTKKDTGATGGIKTLLRRGIVKFSLISILTGIVRTTVVFWMATYISQYLGFPDKTSSLLYSVATFIISFSAFVAIFVYERLGYNMDLTLLLAFSSASICFLMLFVIKNPVINMIILVMAVISSNCAASMLFSRYCPSLRDTGMVSSATGFIDFLSYVAAAVSSKLFANAITDIGWNNLILVWAGLMVIGVIVCLPYDKFKKKTS